MTGPAPLHSSRHPPMTAKDIEREREQMRAEWAKQKASEGRGGGANKLDDEDGLALLMEEEEERGAGKEGALGGRSRHENKILFWSSIVSW